jgi:hypothetical protein
VANTQHDKKLKDNRVIIGKTSNESARIVYPATRTALMLSILADALI